MLGVQLDSMILRAFSNLNYSIKSISLRVAMLRKITEVVIFLPIPVIKES